MNDNRWGPDGPPLEAYSRVTNPERFQPLHGAAVTMLRELQAGFDVQRTEGYGLDAELETGPLVMPTVRLVPARAQCAPITVAFWAFPGLSLRCGRWYIDRFPGCGCDACDETSDGEIERLMETIASVTQGRFSERIRLPLLGSARYLYELGGPSRSAGWSRIPRQQARKRIGDGRRTFAWQPWPRRAGEAPATMRRR